MPKAKAPDGISIRFVKQWDIEADQMPTKQDVYAINLDDGYLHHLRETAYDWAIEDVDAEPAGPRRAAIVLGRNVLALVDELRRLRGGSADR